MALPDLKKIGATVIKHGKTDFKKLIITMLIVLKNLEFDLEEN